LVTPEMLQKGSSLRGGKIFLSRTGARFQTVIISKRRMEKEPGIHRWEIPIAYGPVRAFRFLLICNPAQRVRIDEMEIYGTPM